MALKQLIYFREMVKYAHDIVKNLVFFNKLQAVTLQFVYLWCDTFNYAMVYTEFNSFKIYYGAQSETTLQNECSRCAFLYLVKQ